MPRTVTGRRVPCHHEPRHAPLCRQLEEGDEEEAEEEGKEEEEGWV